MRVTRVAALVALVLAAASTAWSSFLYTKIQLESKNRRDQACLRDESSHLDDVRALGQTYRYLEQLKPSERKQTINVFILRNLPQTEQKARHDSAPDFCDEPGIGLREPDPVLPPRPAGLTP